MSRQRVVATSTRTPHTARLVSHSHDSSSRLEGLPLPPKAHKSMPPKKANAKKGPSKAQLENEQQVRALLSAYAGASRASLSRPSAELVKKIEETAEKGKPLECIALAEPLFTPGTQAICDVLAGEEREGTAETKKKPKRGKKQK